MTEGTGPGPIEMLRRDMALLQDLQRGEELAAKIALPAAEAGQRGQRGDQRALAEVAPVVALHTPHRHHGFGVDTVARLDGPEGVAPPASFAPPSATRSSSTSAAR